MSMETRDLFGHILREYTDKCEEDKKKKSLDGYLEFARNYLMQNPPTQIKYLSAGLGVQLQSGVVLPFTIGQLRPDGMQDESIAIIKAPVVYIPTRDIVPDTSVPLTKNV